ncbi:MAG: hypothetical protein DRI81_11700 [Chloroflexi bacterium]|nr:MAG: hypothetical protein DRI81_11700 [Chloroflexota bacterium]
MVTWIRKHYRDVAMLGIYCALTIAMTWPLPAQMSTHLAGDDVDVLINPWADWWTQKALTEGLDFYHTDYLFYPHGVSLVFHSFSHVNTAISLLLTPLIGHFAAYNLAILLTYAVSGFGMYLLANHLTGCRPAAFVAGVVFAFPPYHLFQSSHPVLVTTQFMPLFALAFIRMLRDASANRVAQTLLAALWFLLTALSSWHLMLMLAGWAAIYLLYGLLFERAEWSPGAIRHLFLLVVVIALAIAPFLWPIVHEQLVTDTSYMAVKVAEGRGNDLLSFLTPNRLHPVFGPLVSEINSRIGYTRNWPAYLGYTALGLALAGVAAARRRTRFWWMSGLAFLFLSLGAQIKWEGAPLHTFQLPWAAPIIAVLRHPMRLNSLTFFSLAILVGFGGRWLYERLALRTRPLAYLVLSLLTGLLLFEYWVFPFPTTRPSYSPFLHQLSQEEENFAVADFPMGRQEAKYYLFFQTIHGKKIVDGVVSRTPHDAYAFVATDPLLGPLRNENVPTEHLADRLAVLAAQDIRYIIVHKRFLDSARMENWQKWLAHFPPPCYEDELLIAYSTIPPLKTELLQDGDVHRIEAQLGNHVHLRGYRLSSDELSAGDVLTVTLLWQSDSRLSAEYHIFAHLLDGGGQLAAQHDGAPGGGERPTWSWRNGEIIQDEHVLIADRDLPAGEYTLSVGMYDLSTGVRLPAVDSNGERLPENRILLQDIQVILP